MDQDLDESVLNATQRRQRALTMKRFRGKIEAARERMTHRAASSDRLNSRARHKAILILRNKFAGKAGADYSNLSTSQKMMIDKRVNQRKSIIGRIAKRLLPSVRRADIDRLSGQKSTSGPTVTEDVNSLFEALGDYKLVRTKEKMSTSAHPDGKHVHEIHHEGKKIGTISPYTASVDKKKPGARIVSSRKYATHYQVDFDKGHGPDNWSIPTHQKMKHANPTHAFEAGVKIHTEWSSNVKESVDIDELFEAFVLGVEDPSLSKDPKKRFHQLLDKEGKVKLDGRFKIWRKKAQIKQQYLDTGIDEETVADLVNMVYEETSDQKYIVKCKSPFYKQDHFVNTHETPQAVLIKRHINHATRMSLEDATKQAKALGGHPNKYKTEIVPMNEELDLNENFKTGDKVKYETSKYSKDNEGVVHSLEGDHVTIKGKNWLNGDQMISVHKGFVRKANMNESVDLDESFESTIRDRLNEAIKFAPGVYPNVDHMGGKRLSVSDTQKPQSSKTLQSPEELGKTHAINNVPKLTMKKFKNELGKTISPVYTNGYLIYSMSHHKHKTQMDSMKESVDLDENIKGWKHAGSDLNKWRASQGKDVKLVALKKNGEENKMSTASKMFRSEDDANEHHSRVRGLNPNSNIRHNLYVNGKLVKTLDEAVLEDGTKKLVKSYKKMTPGESINEAFENRFLAEDADITASQLKKFEGIVDALFKKYGIDFDFTKHFEERLNHDRNNPKITLKELAELVKKIYAKKGNPLKGKEGTEVVIKDLQTDLNIPVAIRYDSKNDEIDVVLKTVMRKKAFTSPDPIVRY